METPRVLLLSEVAILLRVAPVTIYRWLAESRAGREHFPLPVSQRGRKLRWLATDIERYLASQANTTPNTTILNVSSPSRERKNYERRQSEAATALQKHRNARTKQTKIIFN